jgi:molybdopterin converting factor small subunit
MAAERIRVSIKIYYMSIFQDGYMNLEFNKGATMLDVLNELNIRYGEAFKTETGKCLLDAFYSYFKVFLDGSYVDLPLESSGKLKDDDKLLIFRPVSGG